jgi:hypothetical protein
MIYSQFPFPLTLAALAFSSKLFLEKMNYLTTNGDIHQFWSFKFRQKDRNKPSEELMTRLLTDYPDIENWTSRECLKAMQDYQDAQMRGDIPPTVIPSPRTR